MSNIFHHEARPLWSEGSSDIILEANPTSQPCGLARHASQDSFSSTPFPHNAAILTSSANTNGGNGQIRWAMLAAACLVMFGNYYAFDNPASLNQPLQEYMQMTDEIYAYFLNILYTAYSLPNIVLPWLGGYAADKFGHRRLLLSLSATVAFGHFVVCLGVEKRNVPAIILGRVLFGAGESLAVTQSAITVKYFRGKELAMALGFNLCVARLGSVLNDVLTPYIWSKSSVPAAFWGGFVSCVLSFMTACVLVLLDYRFESTIATGFMRVPTTYPSNIRLSHDSVLLTRERSSNASVNPMSRRHYDPLTHSIGTKSSIDETINMAVLHTSGRTIRGSSEGYAREQVTEYTMVDPEEPDTKELACRARESVELGSDNQDDSDTEEEVAKLASSSETEDPNRNGRVSPFSQCLAIMVAASNYTQSFWTLFAMTFLLVGVQVPFNSIHAGFLQMRWYHNDPQKAAQIMTVPDLLSAILVLPVGYFVDHYGQKSWLFMLCGLIIGFSHFVLGIIPIVTPVPALMALGISSAIGAIFTSAIPALVKSHQMATAYGISVSSMNLAFSVFPLIVAKLMTVDPSIYTYVEIFFSCCGFGGFFLAIRLRCLDIYGDLDRREIDNKANM